MAVSLAIGLVGCASGGGGAPASGAAKPSAPAVARATNTNVITADEIAASQSLTTAIDAVMKLRPQWARVAIYVNERPFGAFERLQEIPIAQVKEIHMLSREEARVRFGPEAQQAILVTKK